MRMLKILALLLLALPVAAQQESLPALYRETPPDANLLRLEEMPLTDAASGQPYEMRRPLFLTHAGDGTGRLFLLEQGGRISVIDPQTSARQLFLDLTEKVTWDANSGGYTERGLLGLAFAPDYAESGLFYVNYTDRNGASVLARYRVSADNPDAADINSAEILFTVPQPFPNHNGGHLAFGPDGYLYVSLGDGGSANDPLGAGQNIELLLGKILRLDVSQPGAYSIPADNPFVGRAGLDEIWAYGLRNVWRFSFDRATGDLYLGDVGQNQYEEINFEPAGSAGGFNYGWNAFEASRVFNRNVSAPDAVLPIAEYDHSLGCSVTGGYVYRGATLADTLDGVYLYGDYCSGRVWAAYRSPQGAWNSDVFLQTGLQISSFGEDEAGELYIVDYGGRLFRILPAS